MRIVILVLSGTHWLPRNLLLRASSPPPTTMYPLVRSKSSSISESQCVSAWLRAALVLSSTIKIYLRPPFLNDHGGFNAKEFS